MSDTISGYIDRSYVKGLTYKYGGCPIPTVFTGNINDISDNLLGKAIYVINNGTENGTFPNATSGTYLITTYEYGNAMVLQSCVDIGSNIEYNRIYQNGAWTEWKSASSDVTNIQNQLTGTNGIVPRLDRAEGNISTLQDTVNGTSTEQGLVGKVNIINTNLTSYNSRIENLENNSLKQIVSTKLSDCVETRPDGSATGPKYEVVSGYFAKVGFMCSLTLTIDVRGPVTIPSGSKIATITPGTLVNNYWPYHVAFNDGYASDLNASGSNLGIKCSIWMGRYSNAGKRIIYTNTGDDIVIPSNSIYVLRPNITWTYSGGES